jgi:formate dehydrogenase subunit gamma
VTTQVRLIPRYRLMQRISHWAFTASFGVLLLSGLALFVPEVSYWAASNAGRFIHRGAAVVFALTPLFYFLTDRQGFLQLVSESFSYSADDLAWFKHFVPYAFGKAANLPPQGRINAGEKLHHAAIILGFVLISVSGMVLWIWADIPAEARLTVLMAHDLAMLGMAVLTVGHVFFVFVYGAFSGMWNGHVTEAYARMEHPKWLAKMRADGKVVPPES